MQDLLNNPAIQAGVAPLLVALVVAAGLSRTRLAWLAIVAGYATMIALSTGFAFWPLSASRKVLLLVLAAPLAGLAVDRTVKSSSDIRWAGLLAVTAGTAAIWSFWSVLSQRDLGAAVVAGALIAIAAAAIVGFTLRLRDDGVALAATGLGLGLASGIAALLSASSGYFMAGIALAAASGAVTVVQLVLRRSLVPGLAGALSIGLAAALFACASLMIAQLPWTALALMALIPLATGLVRVPATGGGQAGGVWSRTAKSVAIALPVAALPVAAAWYATLAP